MTYSNTNVINLYHRKDVLSLEEEYLNIEYIPPPPLCGYSSQPSGFFGIDCLS